jgi:NAD(P)-dependent dehydrogenase (short-subunit alcohol dehydrogenase family)
MSEGANAADMPDMVRRRLDGQVAVVSGGGRGIGRAIALAFADAGARTVVADIDAGTGDQVVAEVQEQGGESVACRTDVTAPDSVDALFERVVQAFGRVDVVVNSAGVIDTCHLLDVTPAEWRRVLTVNLDGTLLMIQASARIMRAQEPSATTACRGKIVNIGSGAAEAATPTAVAYGASKAAVNHLSRTAGAALAEHAIATTVLYPTTVREGMWTERPGRLATMQGRGIEEIVRERVESMPTGRFQRADEVAAMALYIVCTPGLRLNGRVLWSGAHVMAL